MIEQIKSCVDENPKTTPTVNTWCDLAPSFFDIARRREPSVFLLAVDTTRISSARQESR